MSLSEDKHQEYVIKWSQQPSIRQKYPCLKLLYHIGNERKCSPAEGARLKRLGVKPGVPDLHLPVSRGKYHGLYIEMKNEDGKTSDKQDWWIEELSTEGYFCEVCHGWESAVRVLEWYLCL